MIGRFARSRPERRGEGKPRPSRSWLHHYCGQRHKKGTSPYGGLLRKSEWFRKLKASKVELPTPDAMIAWPECRCVARKVVLVITNTTLFPGNHDSVAHLQTSPCVRLWQSCSGSAVSTRKDAGERFTSSLENRWIPPPAFCTLPDARFYATILRKSRMRRRARTDLAGAISIGRPYRDT